MVDVSVILIGYNDAKRLPKALASIQNQSLRSIEIIAVDDCSTDNSLDVLESAARLDSRITVVSMPENSGGCSAPRNRGMEMAQGQYIMFCDSDDTFDRHACRNLFHAAQNLKADVVVGAAMRFIIDTGESKLWWPELHSETRIVDQLSECTDLLYDTISVNKIYRRELLVNNDIDFPAGLLFEDQLFTLKVYLAAQRIGIIPEVVYHWNVVREHGSTSITQSRRELRNLRDRIAINQKMDNLLVDRHSIQMAKHIKFLRHEASLYLTTIFQSESEVAHQLASELAEYCRTIPVQAYEHIRPGIRIALYYLLTGDLDNLITSLWWEKGGGVIASFIDVAPTGQAQWNPGRGECLGLPQSWWLDATELHLPLIPVGRRRYLHTWNHQDELFSGLITTVDPFGDLGPEVSAEVLFIEDRYGALASIPMEYVSREGNTITWRIPADSPSLIQDRGINQAESGTVVVELTHESWVNRSALIDGEGNRTATVIDLGSVASLNCADSLVLDRDQRGSLTWSAHGMARGMGALTRKITRKLAPSEGQRPATFDLPTDRPLFIYVPAQLPDFETRMTRFDTQAWIDEFGTTAFLLVPQERFTPTPARFTYAYRTYSAQRLAAALASADHLITDTPEHASLDRAIVFRQDLGAARYLLPALSVAHLNTTEALHEKVREILRGRELVSEPS